MSNYSKTTDFAAKDSLPSGDAAKIIRGSEFETEFDNISTAIATKADSASPTFTGTVTIDGLTVNGNTTLGNAATDTVTVTADIASNLIPSADNTHDLGASGAEWKDLYVNGTAYVDTLDLNGAAVTSTATELNLLDGATVTTAEINILDGVTATTAEINLLDGVTSTTAELNILDGVTATAAELNTLDGITSTTAELNILDGVTSTTSELNLVDGSTAGTVVNSKAVVYGASGEVNATTLQVGGVAITSTPAELNLLDGATVTTAEINILDGVTATTAELNILDGVTSTAAELNILDGVTATATELNILDGVTATTAELNIMDGVTATTAELNLLDGVTSTTAELNILDGVTATATEINLLDGVTATTAELNILDGVTSTAAELNILDGVTATTAELNILDGVTSTATELNLLDGITGILDEDNMASNSATALATQQSIKAYVDTTVAATNELVEDTTPQLGGDLDLNSNDITGTGNINVTGSVTANSAVIDNITIDGNDITTTDSNGNLNLTPNGTGDVQVFSDRLKIRSAEGESVSIMLAADEQDDAGDSWSVKANTDNTFVIQNDISGAADVTHLSITPNATVVNSTTAIAGGITVAGTSVLTGNVGIGASSPSENLTIQSAVPTLRLQGTSNTNKNITVRYNESNDYGQINVDESGVNQKDLWITALNIKLGRNTSSESAKIDSSGNLLVGRSSTSGVDVDGHVLFDTGASYQSMTSNSLQFLNRNGTDGSLLSFYKGGSAVGSIQARGGDLVIGTDDTGIRFNDANNALQPHNATDVTDATIDIGLSSHRFQDIYASNGTIQTSDRNEKQDIEALSDAEQRVAVACKGLLRKFRWKSSVADKGDDARIHFGIIAQDLQAAFEAEGLDAGRYGMFINSTWTDEETGEERSRMGVRYSELLAFIIAAI